MIQNMSIDGVDLLRDLGLYVQSRSIKLPEPKTLFVEVPGANGAIDLSTALTGGDMKFDDRTVTVVFTEARDYNAGRDALAKLLHGRSVRFSFHDDPEHYFIARRAQIDGWKYDEANISEFTVVFQAHPYRYINDPTRIEFDADGSTLMLPNRRMWTRATFTAAKSMNVSHGGEMWSLQAGVPRTIHDLVIREGETALNFSGTGKVVIEYQEGEL